MSDTDHGGTEVRLCAYLADISAHPTPTGLAGFSPREGSVGRQRHRKLSVAGAALTVSAVVAVATVTWINHRSTSGQQGATGPSSAAAPPTPGIPTPRFAEAMAYDPVHGQAVLFGGEGARDSLADTWAWDGHSWEQAHPATSPPPREAASMAYDPALQAVILIGGDVYTATAACPDPYRAYEMRRLSQGGPPGRSPSPDPCVGPVARHDMWAWNGTTWRELGASPLSGRIGGLAWDAATQQLVAVADGRDARTWVLSGTTWTEQSTTWSAGVSPDVLEMATDPSTGRPLALIFGVGPPCNGGAAARPAALGNHGLDAPGLSSEGQTINCGVEDAPGSYSGYIASTWTWVGDTWRQLFAADMPFPPGPMASDASSKTLVLLVQSGTWTWTGSEWLRHTPSPTPPIPTPFGAAFGAMAEDASGHVVYLAAGAACSGSGPCTAGAMPGNATWIWDGRAWSENPQ